MSAQLAPVGAPHEQAPQVVVPEKPVKKLLLVMPVGQVAAMPSIITHRGVGFAGTQTRPAPQPPPNVVVPQNRPVVCQVVVPGVAVPVALQFPPLGAKAPTETPCRNPPLVVHGGFVQVVVEEESVPADIPSPVPAHAAAVCRP
jgi:hypothetical protein